MTATRKDGFTPPRTDLPTVGMVIVVFEDQMKPRYYGPVTVVAVDTERPRITLRCGTIACNGMWCETDEVYDGGTPLSGGPPYAILRWNLVTDLNDRDRSRTDKYIKWLAEKEPEARASTEAWLATQREYVEQLMARRQAQLV